MLDSAENESLSLSFEQTSLLCGEMLSLFDYEDMDVLMINGLIVDIRDNKFSVFTVALAVAPDGIGYTLMVMELKDVYGDGHESWTGAELTAMRLFA